MPGIRKWCGAIVRARVVESRRAGHSLTRLVRPGGALKGGGAYVAGQKGREFSQLTAGGPGGGVLAAARARAVSSDKESPQSQVFNDIIITYLQPLLFIHNCETLLGIVSDSGFFLVTEHLPGTEHFFTGFLNIVILT